MATVPLQFTKVAKEVKLMARAEGISIRQYIEGWLMTMNSSSNAKISPSGWCILSKPGLDHNFKRSSLFPTQVINLLLQFDLRVGLVFSIQREKDGYHVGSCHLSPGKLMSL